MTSRIEHLELKVNWLDSCLTQVKTHFMSLNDMFDMMTNAFTEMQKKVERMNVRIERLEANMLHKHTERKEEKTLDDYSDLKCVLLHPKTIPPTRKHYADGGYDVRVYFRPTEILNKELQPRQMKNRVQFQRSDDGKHFKAVVNPGDRIVLPTNIIMSSSAEILPTLKPRSGLARNWGVDVLAGVIDSGYRNELAVILINHGIEPITFVEGERVAQIAPYKIALEKNLQFQVVQSLPSPERISSSDKVRDQGGFGSTGRV